MSFLVKMPLETWGDIQSRMIKSGIDFHDPMIPKLVELTSHHEFEMVLEFRDQQHLTMFMLRWS